MISKRYKDIFNQYIYKGERTPFSIGTLVVCALCFLLLIIVSFTQINIVLPWFDATSEAIAYNPQIPAIIFIIYLLGRGYSILIFLAYLLIGLFFCPIFAFGGGLEYFQNYLSGYFLGFFIAAIIMGTILIKSHCIKARLMATLLAILSIHITGFIYCLFLAIFKVIDFNILMPIVNAISFSKIIYDIFFSAILISIAPFIKNIFWICMKPKQDKKKKKRLDYHYSQQ